MKCPNCVDVELLLSDRQGVEIDYCPQCRGVWLDRGELDKLIERSLSPSPGRARHQDAPLRQPDFQDSDFRKRSGGAAPGGLGAKLGGLAGLGGLGGGLPGGFAAGSKQKKKKSWLSDGAP